MPEHSGYQTDTPMPEVLSAWDNNTTENMDDIYAKTNVIILRSVKFRPIHHNPVTSRSEERLFKAGQTRNERLELHTNELEIVKTRFKSGGPARLAFRDEPG